MGRWVRRVRASITLGLIWGVAWGMGAVLIAAASTLVGAPDDLFDAPAAAMAMPGFVGGVIFSVILGVLGRRHRFSELSVRRFAAWGALGGLLLALVPLALVTVGLATPNVSIWRFTAVLVPPLTLLCSASAAGSLMLARRLERNQVSA